MQEFMSSHNSIISSVQNTSDAQMVYMQAQLEITPPYVKNLALVKPHAIQILVSYTQTIRRGIQLPCTHGQQYILTTPF